jgi:hypothetical protein
MSTAPWRFTPKEVKRAKKALTEAGLEIAAVIFRKDGFEFRTKTKAEEKPVDVADEWKVA